VIENIEDVRTELNGRLTPNREVFEDGHVNPLVARSIDSICPSAEIRYGIERSGSGRSG
jgi:hypothetical protein